MTATQIFYTIATAVYLLLSVLTLQRLLSGWWRRYYLLTILLILNIFIVVPYFSSLVSYGNWKLASAQKLYWLLALIAQSTIFLVVLQLTYQISRDTPAMATLVRLLTLMALGTAAISLAFHSGNTRNTFMSLVTRDLTFIAAIMNMILWRFLIKVRKRDYLLLAICAGIGIQSAGDAIGHSIRAFSPHTGDSRSVLEFGNILMSLTSVLTIAIWHRAFLRAKLNTTSSLSQKLQRQAVAGQFDPAAGVDAPH